MTRRDQVGAVAHAAGITNAQARVALDAAAEAIKLALLEDGRTSLLGLGTFTVHRRAPRRVRNPATGVMMDLPPSAVVRFKPELGLRLRVQERHA